MRRAVCVLLFGLVLAGSAAAQRGYRHFGSRGGFHTWRGPHAGLGHFGRFHRPFFGRVFPGTFYRRPFFGFYGGFYPLSYPVFFGGAYPVPRAPSVTIIYLPPAPPPVWQPAPQQPPESSELRPPPPPAPEPAIRFQIPLDDGTIHTALAYWVVGDTLHLVDVRGQQHSVPLERVNRELADRLNRERGVEFGLPPQK
jgi:hypothetical protein